MDMSNVDLNAPFNMNDRTPTPVTITPVEEAPAPESVEEEAVVTPAAPAAEPEEEPNNEPVGENSVPYSRFKKFHEESKFYKEQAEFWKKQAENLNQPQVQQPQTNLPDWWVKLYGDSPESAEAWAIQSQANEQLKAEAREEAIKALTEQQAQEETRVEANLEYIDSSIDDLQGTLGRALTSKEESALLDIVDEYTPKDEDGNYLGPLIPFDKAWEIYELQTRATKAPSNQARDSVAALSGASSQGESSAAEEANKNFNPMDWNAWQKRI